MPSEAGSSWGMGTSWKEEEVRDERDERVGIAHERKSVFFFTFDQEMLLFF